MSQNQLTDEQVVRVLAERDGWFLWQEVRGLTKFTTLQVVLKDREPWRRVQNHEEAKQRYTLLKWADYDWRKVINAGQLPNYLTSLDALRPVLATLTEHEWSELAWALKSEREQTEMMTTQFYLTLPPSKLAHAIAEVLK